MLFIKECNKVVSSILGIIIEGGNFYDVIKYFGSIHFLYVEEIGKGKDQIELTHLLSV